MSIIIYLSSLNISSWSGSWNIQSLVIALTHTLRDDISISMFLVSGTKLENPKKNTQTLGTCRTIHKQQIRDEEAAKINILPTGPPWHL